MNRLKLASPYLCAFACVALAFGLGARSAQVKPVTITADRFVLKGPDGAIHGSWNVLDDGTTQLSTFNSKGSITMRVGADGQTSISQQFGAPLNGNAIESSTRPDGTSEIGLLGPNGQYRARLGLDLDRTILALTDPGRTGVWVEVRDDGRRMIHMKGHDGPAGLMIEDDGTGETKISFVDKAGHKPAEMGLKGDLAYFTLRDDNGKSRFAATLDHDSNAHLLIFNRDDAEPIVNMP